MLPTTPNPIRIALNRITFAARETEIAIIESMGWPAWVADQLAPTEGDDPGLATHLARQTMRIRYEAPGNSTGMWVATDEMRTLNYLTADTVRLWKVSRNVGTYYHSNERLRISQELGAATWIRNAHSRYQLREFMADFWSNHFNIGKSENPHATSLLPRLDQALRRHALGNFRAMLEATATSTSMLVYLDNWVSTASRPNENYAREIMELHTLGGDAYFGTKQPAAVPVGSNGVAIGFTDDDIVQASRALSGWTIQYGQAGLNGTLFDTTGEFVFNPRQHNRSAGTLLGVNIQSSVNDMQQGRKLLDILAYHPATAKFIVGKMARRIFGDTPPQSVIDRGVAAWLSNQLAPDQIGRVLHAMLLGGNEVMTAPVTKVRRPYERIIAMVRTTDMVLNAGTYMHSLLDSLTDGFFAWQAPDGRPDVNKYWLATGAMVSTWNLLFQVPHYPEFASRSLTLQTPVDALQSATAVVEYWVKRMVGHALSANAMNALVLDQAGSNGIPTIVRSSTATAQRIENAHRRLISLIATSEEFSLR